MPLRLLVLVALLAPSLAAARGVGLGVGAELPPVILAEHADVDYEQRLVSLELPVFAGRLRFAPAVAYASGVEPNGGGASGPEVTRLSVGASVGWTLAPAEEVRGWVGPRGGAVFRTVGVQSEATDAFVGAVLGGEYFFFPAVSLGAEVRVTYSSLGAALHRSGSSNRLGAPGPYTPYEPEVRVSRGWSLLGDTAVSLRFYPW